MKRIKGDSIRNETVMGGASEAGDGNPAEAGSTVFGRKRRASGGKRREAEGKEDGTPPGNDPAGGGTRVADLSGARRKAAPDEIAAGCRPFPGALEAVESQGVPRGGPEPRGRVPADVPARRIEDIEEVLRDIVSGFAGKPVEESLESLAVFILGIAAVGLVEGSVGIRDIDLPKFLSLLPRAAKGANRGGKGACSGGGGLSDAAAEAIRRKILGLDE